jgi:hypothetical protein
MYVQPLDGSLGPNSLASPPGGAEAESALFAGAAPASAGDDISRFVPPWLNETTSASPYADGYGSGSVQGLFGPLMGILQQLMQMLGSLMGYGCNSPYGSGGCAPYGNQSYFQNATGSSDGDPHLSFNGAKWSNMASQPDLLNSNSFPGGFGISTQVTPANDKGVTWNQSATISLNNGATTIGMNNNGEASITSYGQSIAIQPGQTLQLGNGESVTYAQNGALRVSAQNGTGGRIEATLTPEGKGVNVDVTGHDVDLGGTLVNGYQQHQPIPTPISGPIGPVLPIGNPVPTPVQGPYPIPPPVSPPIEPL